MKRRTVSAPLPAVERTALELLEPLAFWASVLLPAVYLPLLYGGLGDGQWQPFLGLIAANVVCLVVGHGHGR